jgi:hypothetical protein
MSRRLEPLTLYRMDELVSEEQVKVGVPVNPDVTASQNYHPFYFDKTIHLRRTFNITGRIVINGQEVFETATYSYGLRGHQRRHDPIDQARHGRGYGRHDDYR